MNRKLGTTHDLFITQIQIQMFSKLIVSNSNRTSFLKSYRLDPTTLNEMIKSCLKVGQLKHACDLFYDNPTSRNIVSWNMMIAGYVKNNQIHIARKLFDEMPGRDIVSWNTWLSALLKNHTHAHAHAHAHAQHSTYHSYLLLQRTGLRPSSHTFSILITSFLGTFLIPQLHAQIISSGHYSSVFVGSALLRGYTSLKDHSLLFRVFTDVVDKDISVWNALLLGYMDLGSTFEAQKAFDSMPEKDVISWTIMINGYMKNKEVHRARFIFNEMDEKNVVSWTAMITGYVGINMCFDALLLFVQMMRSGPRPTHHTFASILAACAKQSELRAGQQVHGSIVTHGITVDVVLATAFVNMYARCGDIEAVFCIFEKMPVKNLVSWNSLLGCLARHGQAPRALDEFGNMVSVGVRPNHITFINVLSACAHGGLVEEGEMIFRMMEENYSIKQEKEHYACMVDLYGRAGDLEKARNLIEHMPLKPDKVVWGAFLAGCGLHSDYKSGSNAADALHNLENNHPAAYMMLLKILGENGIWSPLRELKQEMEDKHLKRHKSGSWIG